MARHLVLMDLAMDIRSSHRQLYRQQYLDINFKEAVIIGNKLKIGKDRQESASPAA